MLIQVVVHVKDNIQMDINNTYVTMEKFKCDVCDKIFSDSCSLKQHKGIHTGDKSYRCDICDKVFDTSSNLKNHEKIHTGDKPYKCDVCDKVFTNSSHSMRHKRMVIIFTNMMFVI